MSNQPYNFRLATWQDTMMPTSGASYVTSDANADNWSTMELTVPADGYKGVNEISNCGAMHTPKVRRSRLNDEMNCNVCGLYCKLVSPSRLTVHSLGLTGVDVFFFLSINVLVRKAYAAPTAASDEPKCPTLDLNRRPPTFWKTPKKGCVKDSSRSVKYPGMDDIVSNPTCHWSGSTTEHGGPFLRIGLGESSQRIQPDSGSQRRRDQIKHGRQKEDEEASGKCVRDNGERAESPLYKRIADEVDLLIVLTQKCCRRYEYMDIHGTFVMDIQYHESDQELSGCESRKYADLLSLDW
jgi:hypothetical protein